MNNSSFAAQAAVYIKQLAPNFVPKLGIVLGSGLSKLADQIENRITISFEKLASFPQSVTEGQQGKLHLGTLANFPVVCLQGRAHWYDGSSATVIQTIIRTLKLIGCETLLLTNAAGSLRTDMLPGNLMLITDHINFQFQNPLVGLNDENFGPRFVSMENAYDADLRQRMQMIAQQANIALASGVYIGVLGPAFETPAEIKAYKILGADAVGMSTVPEVIVARHCGLKVVAISAISNLAAGMSPIELSHDLTLAGAAQASKDLMTLVYKFTANLEF